MVHSWKQRTRPTDCSIDRLYSSGIELSEWRVFMITERGKSSTRGGREQRLQVDVLLIDISVDAAKPTDLR